MPTVNFFGGELVSVRSFILNIPMIYKFCVYCNEFILIFVLDFFDTSELSADMNDSIPWTDWPITAGNTIYNNLRKFNSNIILDVNW